VESVIIDKSLTKEEIYKSLLLQIRALIEGEDDFIANLGNICSALKYGMDGFFWVGFYFRRGNELVLGPFQGPVACTRITIPNGVCGAAVERKQTIIVDDVNSFPGHIACSADSKSEIVVPVFVNGEVAAVLDIDSDLPANFNSIDAVYIEELCEIVARLISK